MWDGGDDGAAAVVERGCVAVVSPGSAAYAVAPGRPLDNDTLYFVRALPVDSAGNRCLSHVWL